MAAKTALSSSSSCFICVVCSRDCHSHIGNVLARPRIAKGAQALLLKTSPVSDPPFIYPLVTNRYSFRLSLTTITMMMTTIIIIVIIIVIMTNDQKFEKKNKHKRTNTKNQEFDFTKSTSRNFNNSKIPAMTYRKCAWIKFCLHIRMSVHWHESNLLCYSCNLNLKFLAISV